MKKQHLTRIKAICYNKNIQKKGEIKIMTKENIIQSIKATGLTVTGVHFVRIYGTGSGVGYDMTLTLSDGGIIRAHASSRSWDTPRHQRPSQTIYNAYRGRDKNPGRYMERIENYFMNGDGLWNYFRHYKKTDLNYFWNLIK